MPRLLKGPPPGRRIPAAEQAERDRAAAVRAEAEASAAATRAAAEADRERVRAEAAEAGLAEGLARAAATLAAAAAERDRRLAALEGEIVTLAVEIARRILGRELALDPGAVRELAARALAEARGRRDVALRVNPADAARLRADAPRLAALAGAPGPLALREDPAIPEGGVLVETEAGRVDARIETQLAALERALREAR
jgi:flagellar biosynthesis/type III secretory pathway protein FliH